MRSSFSCPDLELCETVDTLSIADQGQTDVFGACSLAGSPAVAYHRGVARGRLGSSAFADAVPHEVDHIPSAFSSAVAAKLAAFSPCNVRSASCPPEADVFSESDLISPLTRSMSWPRRQREEEEEEEEDEEDDDDEDDVAMELDEFVIAMASSGEGGWDVSVEEEEDLRWVMPEQCHGVVAGQLPGAFTSLVSL